MQTFYKIRHYQLNTDSSRSFRSGYKYLIFFIIRGTCCLLTDSQKQLCLSPDMILSKPGQTFCIAASQSPCSLLSVSVSPESLAALSDDACDLAEKFRFAPYHISAIHPEIEASMLMRNILNKLDTLEEDELTLGAELYEKSLFTAFLVLFLRTCVQSDQRHQLHQKKILIIDDVFQYIGEHLAEDLSLKKLEKEFFVSGEHISREFKKSTGMTLHSYITQSRIDLSKKYLLQGIPVRDVCQLCGFGSYNHFFKAFKKECGMTPMSYYRKVME